MLVSPSTPLGTEVSPTVVAVLNPGVNEWHDGVEFLSDVREFKTIGEAIVTLTLSTIAPLPYVPADLTPYSAANDPHGFAAKGYQVTKGR
jgi:hypothetical protein